MWCTKITLGQTMPLRRTPRKALGCVSKHNKIWSKVASNVQEDGARSSNRTKTASNTTLYSRLMSTRREPLSHKVKFDSIPEQPNQCAFKLSNQKRELNILRTQAKANLDADFAREVLDIHKHHDKVEIVWADGETSGADQKGKFVAACVSAFHFVWLRDTCRCHSCYHPDARERMVDTLQIPLNVEPHTIDLIISGAGPELRILWKEESGARGAASGEGGHSTSKLYTEGQKRAIWSAERVFESERPSTERFHESLYPLDWLREQGLYRECRESAFYGQFLWEVKDFESPANVSKKECNEQSRPHGDRHTQLQCESKLALPSFEFENLACGEEQHLRGWMEQIRTYGFSLVRNMPEGEGRCMELASKISFLRQTFWGSHFVVRSDPKPSNLSLTGAELQPHTDFSWCEMPPGLQFLHCQRFRSAQLGVAKAARQLCEVETQATGGESTLVDGYAVAEALRAEDPQSFELLSTVQLPFYFASDEHHYTYKGTVISLDSSGLVSSLRFNQANLGPLDVPAALVLPSYRALQRFVTLTRSPKFLLKFRLQEGQMLVFDNRRMLHGRTAYNPQLVDRHLDGCYIDKDQFDSKLQQLRAKLQ